MIETKLDGKTPDIAEENIAKLKEIFPDVFCEGKVDFEKLQQVLGNYIEDEDERYNFSWNGKGRSLRLAQSPSTGTLRPCKEESKDWDTTENLYVEGDNLEVLKLLQKSYHGKIKMIYIDPPYNTGHDFVYPDDYTDNMQNYLELTGQVDREGKKITTNPDTNGRYHTDWLNMMYPRLRLARNLLADDGVIFISIDDNEVANLKKLCDEVFGEGNFVGEIVRKTKSMTADNGNGFNLQHEVVVIYAKKSKNIYLIGEEKNFSNYSNPDNDPNGDWCVADPSAKSGGESTNFGIKNPYTHKVDYPPNGRYWAFSEKTLSKYIVTGRIKFKKEYGENERGFIFKRYKDNMSITTEPVNSLFAIENEYMNQSSTIEIKSILGADLFSYPKPISFIKKLVKYSNADVILDFFSGSATTAHAVMQLNAEDGGNRKFICVQLPEPTDEKSEAYKAGYRNICEIGKERIRRAGEKINAEIIESNKQIALDEEEKKLVDVGFRVFKLDTSNIKKWNPDFDNLEDSFVDSINNLVDGRSELDLVYEIMLKYGLDLTYPVEELSCGDKKIYSIAFGMLVICVAEGVSKDVADFIVEYKKKNNIEEMRTVFKDGCFKDDSTQMSIKETLKSAGIEEFITI